MQPDFIFYIDCTHIDSQLIGVDNFVCRFAQNLYTVSSGMFNWVALCVESYAKYLLDKKIGYLFWSVYSNEIF